MAARRFTSIVSEVLVRELLERGLAQDSRVVDEHVEPAPVVRDAVERALDGEGVGHVGRERQRLAARESDLLRGLRDAGGVAVDERHLGAGPGQQAVGRRCPAPRR
jgi:hypothetical protein